MASRIRRSKKRAATAAVRASQAEKKYSDVIGGCGAFTPAAFQEGVNTEAWAQFDGTLAQSNIGTWYETCNEIGTTEGIYNKQSRLLFAAPTAADQSPYGWRQMPTLLGSILRGVGAGQRTGDAIFVKSIEARGYISPVPQAAFDAAQTALSAQPVNLNKASNACNTSFRIVCLRLKQAARAPSSGQLAINPYQQMRDLTEFFQYQGGNSVSSPIAESWKGYVDVLYDQTISLGTSGTQSQAPEYRFSFQIPVNKPARWNKAGDINAPTGTTAQTLIPPQLGDILFAVFSDRSRHCVAADPWNWQGPNPYCWKGNFRVHYTDV